MLPIRVAGLCWQCVVAPAVAVNVEWSFEKGDKTTGADYQGNGIMTAYAQRKRAAFL